MNVQINIDFALPYSLTSSRSLQIDLQLHTERLVRRIVDCHPDQPRWLERWRAEKGEQRRPGAHRGDVRLGGGWKWNARWMRRRYLAGNDTNNYALEHTLARDAPHATFVQVLAISEETYVRRPEIVIII